MLACSATAFMIFVRSSRPVAVVCVVVSVFIGLCPFLCGWCFLVLFRLVVSVGVSMRYNGPTML